MKYSVEIVIDRPIGVVLQLFEDAQSRPCWQRGLQSQKLISGQPNQVGARTRLVFQMGKRRIEMIETITNRRLPYEYDGTYEAQGVFNSVRNRFTAVSGAGTQWVCESEFRFSGLFMKFIGLVFRKSFPAQTLQHMQDFKAYIEQGTDVRQPEQDRGHQTVQMLRRRNTINAAVHQMAARLSSVSPSSRGN